MTDLLFASVALIVTGCALLVGAACMAACREARRGLRTRYDVAFLGCLAVALVGSVFTLYWLGRAVFAGVCR